MSGYVISEDFALTPSLKQSIDEQVSKINQSLKKNEKVRVFIRKLANDLFSAHFQARVQKKELIADIQGQDLYQCINQASHNLIQQIHKYRDKRKTESRRITLRAV